MNRRLFVTLHRILAMRRRLLVSVASTLALAAAPATPAAAGELAGVALPDQITVEGRTLTLNGMGLREATWLKVDVYVAGLYLETKSSDSEAILASPEAKRIVMKFVRRVGRKDLVKAWNEGFEKNAGRDLAALMERIATLNSWMYDVEKGDLLSFIELPGKGVVIEVKGEAKGVIPGTDFARVLWSIWLGPDPPNPGLKQGLLGGR